MKLGAVLDTMNRSSELGSVRFVRREGKSIHRVWSRPPRYRRSERAGPNGTVVTVQDGSTWWRSDPQEGRVTTGTQLGGVIPLGLSSTRFLGDLALRVVEITSYAERKAVRLGFTRRHDFGFLFDGPTLFRSKDAGELVVDLERGVILDGEWGQVSEIAFDEELAEGLFEPPLTNSEAAIPIDVAEWPIEVTLSELRTRAQFPVVLPRRLPRGWRAISYQLDSREPPRAYFAAFVVDPGARYLINLRGNHEPPVERPPSSDPRQIDPFPAHAVRKHEGFYVSISSNLPQGTVNAIADSLSVG
jgi:hypothetical protein